MKEKLYQILLDVMPQTDLSKVNESTQLKADLGLNSVNLLVLIMQIEDTFGFEFTGEESFETVGEVIGYIEKHATK